MAQALRPYPQYSLIDTVSGGGDRLGHSTYHALETKITRRYSAGLTLQASYVLSKAITDSDSYGGVILNGLLQPQAGKIHRGL